MARQRHLAGQRARARSTDGGTTPVVADPAAPVERGRASSEKAQRPDVVREARSSSTAVIDRPVAPAVEPGGAQRAGAGPRVWRLGLSGLSGWSVRARALLAALLVLALLAVAAFVTVALRARHADRVEAARDAAVTSAQSKAVDLLSYDYRHLDRDFATARKALTGGFRADYQATTSKVVRPGALQYRAVVKAEVAAVSVVSASEDRVVVLLFVNQTTTSTRLDGPKVDLNRVRLTMTKVGKDWLVSDVQAL
jgi:Mce-associated membrane protein